MQDNEKDVDDEDKPASMSSLIIWNITKALEKNPVINLKTAMRTAQERLDEDVNTMLQQYPEDRHLVCAMLAWQQLGHSDADSLYKFVESVQKGNSGRNNNNEPKTSSKATNASEDDCVSHKNVESSSFESYSGGLVVKLPVETKIVMRLDTTPSQRASQQQKKTKDASGKLDAACCLDNECAKKLANLDKTTRELRDRAGKLAKREAERVELLERAEAAWKELEAGYQKRLSLAVEKEEDMTKQIEKMIDERNAYKNICSTLMTDLNTKTEQAEKDKPVLLQADKELCERACVKLKLSQECARVEAALAEQQCRTTQLERDLQFKENQARTKVRAQENEVDVARALAIEAERTMRAELAALREQVAAVSAELLAKDADTEGIKNELKRLRQEKLDLIEDLDGCKVLCDARMQGKVNELNKKREKLAELREQVMECRCKFPTDVIVEAKRTPSLAALCTCAPEDKLLESCSCTSLRDRLITNLLEDLFGGLQAELGGNGALIPCQLLKCLEDSHNWDRASVVKTNLKNFFSQLLLGELDIAIATSIEKYHAKWIGESCADVVKACKGEDDNWEDRAINRKAEKLATKLAEQLFQEKADELAQRAKEIVQAAPMPCECKGEERTELTTKRKDVDCRRGNTQAMYPCLVKSGIPSGIPVPQVHSSGNPPSYWKRTHQEFAHLKQQIEDLKKDSIKREDLKQMEEKITKIVQQASNLDNIMDTTPIKETSSPYCESIDKVYKDLNNINNCEITYSAQTKPSINKKKTIETNPLIKKAGRNIFNQSISNDKTNKQNKRFSASYAVNVCLCGPGKGLKAQELQNKTKQDVVLHDQSFIVRKQKMSKDTMNMFQLSSIRQTKPINTIYSSPNADLEKSKQQCCKSDCVCFNKKPSNTSINKLLDTLLKWKCDLIGQEEKCDAERNISEKNGKLKNNPNSHDKFDSKPCVFIDEPITLNNNISKEDFDAITEIKKYNILPQTTESEYMGAINLDKSNEMVCKCKGDNKLYQSQSESNPVKHSESLFKCINSEACDCKKIDAVKIALTKAGTPLSKARSTEIVEMIHHTNKNLDKTYHNQETEMTEDLKIAAATTDYHIKFLGVTLTDATSHKLHTKLATSSENNSKELSTQKRKHSSKRLQKGNYDTNLINVLDKSDSTSSKLKYNSGTYNIVNKNVSKCNEYTDAVFCSENHVSMNRDDPKNENTYNTPTSCVCCVNNEDDSKDLEVNTFYLLEEHLKGKLEEFKTNSCKSSCIPPHEEEKLFADILNKVKKVITDCEKEIKCNCVGQNTDNSGRWNRAVSLLQEYLKIKIQKVQCSCVPQTDDSSDVLSNVFKKVCNLIEHDFDRLKDICKCKNTIVTEQYLYLDNVKHDAKLPEKDPNRFKDIETIKDFGPPVVKVSKNNSAKSVIITENISSQVPPGLGMETKSCDAMSVRTKNVQTTETNVLIRDNTIKSGDVKRADCTCCPNTTHSGLFRELLGAKEVLVSLCTGFIKSNEGNKTDLAENQNKNLRSYESGSESKKYMYLNSNENKNECDENIKCLNVPYIGYTVDCACDKNLGVCVCMKSVIQNNNDKINNIWNSYASNNPGKDLSYIMNSPQLKIDSKKTLITNIPKKLCQSEANTQNLEELIIKVSSDQVATANNTTNTLEENVSLGTEYSNSENPIDWFECSPLPRSEIKTSKDMLKNSILFPRPIEYSKVHKSKVEIDDAGSNMIHQTCDCNVVPICHVKLLVENIENNLINSKCTCDSMTPQVCPVHSQSYHL